MSIDMCIYVGDIMRVDARVGYFGRAGLPRRNDDRRRVRGRGRWWRYGDRVDDTRVSARPSRIRLVLYIFKSHATLCGLRDRTE